MCGGGAVRESIGSLTAYFGRRRPLTSLTISTTVRIGRSRRGKKRSRKKRANQRNIDALSHRLASGGRLVAAGT